MSLALYCLEQAHEQAAQPHAAALGARFIPAWPEAVLDEREYYHYRRQFFSELGQQAVGTLVLSYDACGLALQTLEKPLPGPIRVDFADTSLERRTHHGQAAGEAVARACGVRKGARPRVLDATAGLGRDGWILATLGAHVEMVERVPLVHALLADGLRRARLSASLVGTAESIILHAADAQAVLRAKLELATDARPDVVYLDPMFPHREKSAKVKKEMWAFRHLVGSDLDADELLALARAVATKRVVVKRPRIAADLAGEEPQQRMIGQSNRYDLYTPKALT